MGESWDTYWEERPERVARRRAKFWNLYGRYWGVRAKIASDPVAVTALLGAVAALSGPGVVVAGPIALAALAIDTQLAPEMQELAGSQEAIALLMIEELEADGTVSAAEADRLAQETIHILENPAAQDSEVSPRTSRPQPKATLGTTWGQTPATPSPAASPVPNYLPLAVAALVAIFILRGS